MKSATLILTVAGLLTVSHAALARDDTLMLPIADVVQMGMDQGKLDGSVKFYLSGTNTPPVRATMDDIVSNKKTSSVGKGDVEACNWATLSALMAFEAQAKQHNANAVIDMHSFYRKTVNKDPVNYECHAGNVIAGVALKGTYAKVDK